MNSKFSSITVTLWANRVIMAVVAALLFWLPGILDWYATIRFLSQGEQSAITAAFYCCAAVIFLALVSMDALLRNILTGQVFTVRNVSLIGRVRWCCAAVSLICLPAGFIYPPLIFLTIIMAFLFLVVNVVRQVMKAAVTIREENDLTI